MSKLIYNFNTLTEEQRKELCAIYPATPGVALGSLPSKIPSNDSHFIALDQFGSVLLLAFVPLFYFREYEMPFTICNDYEKFKDYLSQEALLRLL